MKNVFGLLFVLLPALVLSQHRCFTPELISSPSAQSFLKKSGKRFLQFPTVVSADTNQFQTFFTRNIFNQSQWNKLTAQKVFSSSKVVLWLDTALTASFFTIEEIDSLIASFTRNLLVSTSNFSVNPSMGILDLEHEYFGLPPDVDGDGALDILLLDIQDGYPSSGSYIAGFFDPNDLTDLPFSNKRDLLYIDVYPLIKEGNRFTPDPAISTIAHEYQHLIHAHYEENESEYVFINEGLSEFAEIFCGFTPRSGNTYAMAPDRSLLSWNYSDPIPDYSRASLWTEYFFEQIGYKFIKPFVQSPKVGMSAINELLSVATNLPFQQIFANWTLANFINDSSYSPAYSYKHPLRKDFQLQPQYSNDTLPSVNTVVIPNSACYVVQYPFVEQLILAPNNTNSSLSFSALTFQPNGTNSLVPSFASDNIQVTAPQGGNTTVQVLIRNTQYVESEADTSSFSFSYLAKGKKSGRTIQFVYDDGFADAFDNNARYLLVDSANAVGISFVHQYEGWLKEVLVKGIFLSEVSGSGIPINAVRDINMQVYSFRNGFPDSAITEKKHVRFQRPVGVLGFEGIDLNEFYDQLAVLKDTFCIVLSNDSDDNNYFAIGMDNLTGTRSFSYEEDTVTQSFNWISFGLKKIQDSSLTHWNAMVRCYSVFPLQPLQNNAASIELSFTAEQSTITLCPSFPIDSTLSRIVVKTPEGKYFTLSVPDEPTSIIHFPFEGVGRYQTTVSLYSKAGFFTFDTTFVYHFSPPSVFEIGNNFPNPFNALTTIPITVYVPGEIEIQAFNVLGQLVNLVRKNLSKAGAYEIPLKFSRFASSVYFLRAVFKDGDNGRQTIITKKVMLVK